ncbi:phospho-sugar mutase [Nocardioides gilvus]|uniref:phospho-sugar mutase n=1 Tax=Nocardioides gilvus TaxID=1735589 RepID=UPI000D74B7C2|nr:phospho-sugar mutase [Nocardioides gilvus]
MDQGAEPCHDDLLDRAGRWRDEDPDEGTRSELDALLVAARAGDPDATAELTDRFGGPLEFGTAGLRGAMGAGPHRMNRSVVQRAAAGLVAHLQGAGAGAHDIVVIGYDARHHSHTFAQDTAEVVAGAGLRALLMPRPLPTPLLAYAVRDLAAVAGVMVTASHNPAGDNGYKVYLRDGSQIAAPTDREIAARIADVGALTAIPRATTAEFVPEAVIERYLSAVVAVAAAGSRELSVVYTPLHGVGGETVLRVLEDAGFTPPHVVQAQFAPDPDFPTVRFPNPEEPGALDLAMQLAMECGADLVVANDPDADRCAAAVAGPHGWQMLRGDEVGALLAQHLLANGVQGTYATSIVSSSLLSKMAAAAGQPSARTLTGFKWISRVDDLVYGYEEALGYCVDPAHVRDKDGVSALLLLCSIAADAKARDRTLRDLLDDLALAHGHHATDQLSVRFEAPTAIRSAMAALRTSPPTALGGLSVEEIEDLSRPRGDLPPTDGLRYTLAEGAHVIVRPSGTEPKLKCYLEVVTPVDPEDGVDAARIAAAGRLDAIKADLRQVTGG